MKVINFPKFLQTGTGHFELKSRKLAIKSNQIIKSMFMKVKPWKEMLNIWSMKVYFFHMFSIFRTLIEQCNNNILSLEMWRYYNNYLPWIHYSEGYTGHCWWPPFPKSGDGWREFLSLQLVLLFAHWELHSFGRACPGIDWAVFRRGWSLNSSANFCVLQLCNWQLLLVGKTWIYFKVIAVLSLWQQAAATSLVHYPPLPLDLILSRSLGLLSE